MYTCIFACVVGRLHWFQEIFLVLRDAPFVSLENCGLLNGTMASCLQSSLFFLSSQLKSIPFRLFLSVLKFEFIKAHRAISPYVPLTNDCLTCSALSLLF